MCSNLRKVNILLAALEKARKDVDYFALDLSKPELERTFTELGTPRFKNVRLNGLHGTYDDGLAWLSEPENQDRVNCVMTLGSSIGNFDRAAAAKFLNSFSRVLKPADVVIVGVDGTSSKDRIFQAYNDSKGITEQFYRNGLEHANSVLGYDAFKQHEWAIEGRYVDDQHKHEAFYVALADIHTKDFTVAKGSKLSFEHAYKYNEEESDQLWHAAGLVSRAIYTDKTGEYCTSASRCAYITIADKLRPARVAFCTEQFRRRPTSVCKSYRAVNPGLATALDNLGYGYKVDGTAR